MNHDRILAKGRYITNDAFASGLNNNDLIIGATGAGKTTSYVSPNIEQRYGSMVVADTKGRLERLHRAALEADGYRVCCLDFTDVNRSSGYNPLDCIVREGPLGYREQDVNTVAEAIVPLLSKSDPYWSESARTVVKSLIAYTLEALPPEEQHLGSVMEMYPLISTKQGAKLFALLEEDCPKSYAVRLYHLYENVFGADKTWSCISQFVGEALQVFAYEGARRMFAEAPDFRIEDLALQRMALFVNISDTDRSMDRLANIFYGQLFHGLCREADRTPDGRLPVPVHVYLDDFASNVCIPNFPGLISVIRSRNLSVSLMIQNLTQLETMYSPEQAETIVSNCDHVLVMGACNDLKTANYVGTRARKPPESIMMLPRDKVYILERGSEAVLAPRAAPVYSVPRVTAECVPDEVKAPALE